MPHRHAAIYLRVSSASQDLRSQEPDLKSWAAGQGRAVRWYQDKATGATMARPGWEKLWGEVLAGKVASVVCWRLDRLGRTALGLVQLFDGLRARNVELVSIRDGIAGLDSAAGRLTAGILAHVAQYEREVRAERQRAGIDAAKAAGKSFGRPRGTGRPVKVTAAHRELIARLRAEGKGVSAVARLTGLARQTVYAVLKDEGGRGERAGAAPTLPPKREEAGRVVPHRPGAGGADRGGGGGVGGRSVP